MKSTTIVLIVLLSSVGLASGFAQGSEAETSGETISVEFVNPQGFTDFGTRRQPTEKDQKALAEQFRQEVQSLAKRYVPEGHRLSLRVLDIDMAGDFEPHRGADMSDVRIMRAIYAPSLKVEYRVINQAGEVVSSGRRRISDMSYQNIATFRSDEPLFYETELAAQLIREIMRTV